MSTALSRRGFGPPARGALLQSCAMPSPLASRTVDDSRVTMTEIVLPQDTNTHGNIFGGRVLALIDKASAIAAMRHCHAPVVTASIDRVDFLAGARAGSILILEAMLHAAFRTSMEVGVIVHAEDPLSGGRHLTCRALVTLVAVDGSRRPMAVPPLQARNEEEASRAREAAERRQRRKMHG
jgi:acyl-CoA hydrolase